MAQQRKRSTQETSGESDASNWAFEPESEKSDVLAGHYSDDIQDIFKNVQINIEMTFESEMEDWGESSSGKSSRMLLPQSLMNS